MAKSILAPACVFLAAASLSCGCPAKSAVPTPQVSDANTPAPATPDASPTESDAMSSSFVPGPALSPSEPLLAWLEASAAGGERKVLRLPVVLNFANPGRFSFGSCWIGTQPAEPGVGPPADAVLIKPDSTALSVSLVNQVKQKCGDKTLTCVLWLDGFWGPMVEGAPTTPQPAGTTMRWPFAVVEVGDPVDAATATTGFVKP
jgi:hypothetical protein